MKNALKCLTVTCLLAATSTVSQAADGSSDRVHPQFRLLHPGEATNVIVIHRAGAPRGAGPRIEARTGIKLQKHFDQVNQSVARLTELEMDTLANDPEVEYIAPDLPVHAFALD